MQRIAGILTLGLALFITTTATPQDKQPPPKTKAYLPPGWKDLGLDAAQKVKIAAIHDEYKGKVKALEDQVKDLKSAERGAMVATLTDAQKKLLTKLIIGDEEPKKESK